MVIDFTRRTADMQRVSDGNVNGFIFSHNKIVISDDKGMLNKVQEG